MNTQVHKTFYVIDFSIIKMYLFVVGCVQSEEFGLLGINLQSSCLTVGAEAFHFLLDLLFCAGCKSSVIGEVQVVQLGPQLPPNTCVVTL